MINLFSCKHSSITVLLALGLTVLAAGCNMDEKQDDFFDQANQRPAGFSETGPQGTVVKADDDDWRTSPLYLLMVRVDPAFPNPTPSGFVNIPVLVRQANVVRGGLVLQAYNSGSRLITLDALPDARDPGAYMFTFSPGLIGRTGLVRLFIFDGAGELVSYGDLMIQ